MQNSVATQSGMSDRNPWHIKLLTDCFLTGNHVYNEFSICNPLVLLRFQTYGKLAKYSFMPILRQTAENFLDFK